MSDRLPEAMPSPPTTLAPRERARTASTIAVNVVFVNRHPAGASPHRAVRSGEHAAGVGHATRQAI